MRFYRINQKLLCTLLISAMVFTSVDVNLLAAEPAEDTYCETEDQTLDETKEAVVYDDVFDAVEVEAEEDVEEQVDVEEIEVEEEILLEESELPRGTVTTTCADGTEGSITWNIDENGKLTINGTGTVTRINYGQNWPDWPWLNYKDEIKSAKVLLSNFASASGMFFQLENLESIDLIGFDTSNATNMYSMFDGCSSLQTLDVSNFDTSKVTDMEVMFCGCSSLQTLDVSNFDTSNVTDMYGMFSGCSSLQTLDVSNFDTSNVTGMAYMFSGCSGLQTLDLSNFDTSNVTDMSYMFSCYFEDYSSLQTLDVGNFDTSKVTDMQLMFAGCGSLQELDVSNFDTSNVTRMNHMFADCGSLQILDVSNFNTSKVTDMSEMFRGSSLSKLDISNFDTGNVTRMFQMFCGCKNLKTLDVSNFDTSNVTDMRHMFSGCSGLQTLDVRNFNTSKVTDMGDMFVNCSSLQTLDVSNFDTSNVTDMGSMFFGCSGLQTLDLSSFDTRNVHYIDDMFYLCSSLQELNLSNFDLSNLFDIDERGWDIISDDFLHACTSLTKIQAPLSLSYNVALPEGTWKTDDGTIITELPQNLKESVTITKEADETVHFALNKTSLSLTEGENETLTATISNLPEGTTSTTTWTSDNENIAVVDKNGKVTAIKKGTATITATSSYTDENHANGYTAACIVTVNEPAPIEVTGVAINYNNKSISENGLTLNIGNKLTLTANITPDNAAEKTVTWSSSNKDVAAVSANGQVTGVASGNAVITVTTKDGDYTASCNIAVVSGNGTDSASENQASGSDKPGENPGDNPGKDEEQKTTYKVSVTYDSNGLVSANRTGTVSESNISEIKDNSYDVTVVSGNDVTFAVTPNAEYGIEEIKITCGELIVAAQNGKGIKTPDGTIEIGEIDKDGKAVVTIKSVSSNMTVKASFKKTTYSANLKVTNSKVIPIKVVNDKIYDENGKEITSISDISVPVIKGRIFSGWFMTDGTKVTMDNLADIIKSGKTITAHYDYVNIVVKQKVNISDLLITASGKAVNKIDIKKYQIIYSGVKNSKYASITSKGVLTAKKVEADGTPVTVKVEALDSSKNIVGYCYIKIVGTKADKAKITAANSKMNQIGAAADMNEILADSLPKNSYDKINWSVQKNCKSASINEQGILTALDKSGKVKVTAEFVNTNDGIKSAKVTFTVTVKLPKQTVKKASVKTTKTKTLKLSNLSGQKVEWSADNAGVTLDNVTGTDNGKGTNSVVITGVTKGTTYVTAIVNGDKAHPYVYEITVK